MVGQEAQHVASDEREEGDDRMQSNLLAHDARHENLPIQYSLHQTAEDDHEHPRSPALGKGEQDADAA